MASIFTAQRIQSLVPIREIHKRDTKELGVLRETLKLWRGVTKALRYPRNSSSSTCGE
jgi:hypothetical protein